MCLNKPFKFKWFKCILLTILIILVLLFSGCDDVTNAILFLLSDAATMTTGAILPVEGSWLL